MAVCAPRPTHWSVCVGVGVRGPGAQSSLLRIIAGLWTADKGFVSVPRKGVRQGTLFVPQRSYMVKVRRET